MSKINKLKIPQFFAVFVILNGTTQSTVFHLPGLFPLRLGGIGFSPLGLDSHRLSEGLHGVVQFLGTLLTRSMTYKILIEWLFGFLYFRGPNTTHFL